MRPKILARSPTFADSALQKWRHEEWERLYSATRRTLETWIRRLCTEAEHGFPTSSPAFRRTWRCTGVWAKHVRDAAIDTFNEIRYADSETNYWFLSTGGKVLGTAHSRALGAEVAPDEWTNRGAQENQAMQRAAGAAYVFGPGREPRG